MSQLTRIGMIGAGSMANRVHYPSLASFDDVEIAAICDIDAARLQDDGGPVRRGSVATSTIARWSRRSRRMPSTSSATAPSCTTSGPGV